MPISTTVRPTLSLVVITRNEEANIARCLRSVDFVEDVVVVDNGSTDRTVEIARSLGARVLVTPDWPGYGRQKARALDLATGDWVLSLDADEWIEPQFSSAVLKAMTDPSPPDAYKTPRRSRFCGKIVRHSGWSPDYVVRLFRRGHARFSDDMVHEGLIVPGRISRAAFRIEHDGITSWIDAQRKIDLYSDLAAQRMHDEGKRGAPLQPFLHGWTAFLKALVYRAGFLDGSAGLGVAEYNRRYARDKWIKLSRLGR